MSAASLRALVYNRVSADPTGRRISTAAQDRENREYIERQGWVHVESITDDAQSASRFAKREREGRPEVLDALAGHRHGRIDVLVMTAADRGERTLDGHVELRRLCVQHDVKIAYKGKVHDMRDPADRFAAGLDALIAEREADEISARALRSHQTSLLHGTPRGSIPYAYRHEYNPVTGAMSGRVPDPETAPVVREVVARVIGGDPLLGIATDLNRRGVPTPQGRRDLAAGHEPTGRWNATILRQMLRSQALMGVRSYKGLAVRDAAWEPIVSSTDWHKVQQILGDPARAQAPRGNEPRYLLAGIATCGPCGAFLRVGPSHGVRVYRCVGLYQGASKGHVSRGVEPLDRFVERPLLRRLQRPDVLALLAPANGDGGDVAAAQRELADLEARLDGFVVSAAEGGISPTALAAIEARLLPQIEDARARAVPRSLPPALLEVARPDAPAVWDRWGAEPGGLGKKRQVVRALLRVVVHRASVRGVRAFDASTVELSWRGSAAAPE